MCWRWLDYMRISLSFSYIWPSTNIGQCCSSKSLKLDHGLPYILRQISCLPSSHSTWHQSHHSTLVMSSKFSFHTLHDSYGTLIPPLCRSVILLRHTYYIWYHIAQHLFPDLKPLPLQSPCFPISSFCKYNLVPNVSFLHFLNPSVCPKLILVPLYQDQCLECPMCDKAHERKFGAIWPCFSSVLYM